MDANQLIDALGGTAATAKLFDVRAASVSEWRQKGIPKARMQTLRLMRPDLFAAQQPAEVQEAAA